MAEGFEHFFLEGPANRSSLPRPDFRARSPKAFGSGQFETDEAAARFYLSDNRRQIDAPVFRTLSASPSGKDDTQLELDDTVEVPLGENRIVRFRQTYQGIPVFGSRVTVELAPDRSLVGIEGDMADLRGRSFDPAFDEATAKARLLSLVSFAGEATESIPFPVLVLFRPPSVSAFVLAYYFRRVPAAPPGPRPEPTPRRGILGPSLNRARPQFDYFLHAQTGELLAAFPATAALGPPALPVQCDGIDEDRVLRNFLGMEMGAQFMLSDPTRQVVTYDQGFDDAYKEPTDPVQNPTPSWGNSNYAAVSAHANASLVHRYIETVLHRFGLDGKGMPLVSVVNCTVPGLPAPPEWINAQWDGSKMIYGQIRQPDGSFRSLASHLDVIAHELFHGVTETTAGLLYQDQSGALNESFSDIFGVMVKNWSLDPARDPNQWDWEIGGGLGGGDLPLRDVSNPQRTGHPAHMDDYLDTADDNGGVHTNSNIHNKAAYNVITATLADGTPAATPVEVGAFYYQCLLRLSAQALFTDVKRTLLTVVQTFFRGDARAAERIAAVANAYDAVGIK